MNGNNRTIYVGCIFIIRYSTCYTVLALCNQICGGGGGVVVGGGGVVLIFLISVRYYKIKKNTGHMKKSF